MVAAGFHSSEIQRHREEYLRSLDISPNKVPGTEELSFVERFDLLLEKIKPLLKSEDVFDRDWYITPEVPISGVAEGKNFTVFLSIQYQKVSNMITPEIRTDDDKRPGGMRGMYTTRESCERWLSSERKEEPLEELDHVEEAVEVYLTAAAALSPKELYELGFPTDYVPEGIQLTLEDAITP
jgi:hypothetical protein